MTHETRRPIWLSRPVAWLTIVLLTSIGLTVMRAGEPAEATGECRKEPVLFNGGTLTPIVKNGSWDSPGDGVAGSPGVPALTVPVGTSLMVMTASLRSQSGATGIEFAKWGGASGANLTLQLRRNEQEVATTEVWYLVNPSPGQHNLHVEESSGPSAPLKGWNQGIFAVSYWGSTENPPFGAQASAQSATFSGDPTIGLSTTEINSSAIFAYTFNHAVNQAVPAADIDVILFNVFDNPISGMSAAAWPGVVGAYTFAVDLTPDAANEPYSQIALEIVGVVETDPTDTDGDGVRDACDTTLNGTVFEDKTGDGLADGDTNITDAAGDQVAVANASVRVYEDDGDAIPEAATSDVPVGGALTTNAQGAFSLTGKLNQAYWVTVDSKTVAPSLGFNSGATQSQVWPEQTYAGKGGLTFDGTTYTTSGSAGSLFGGKRPTVSDDAPTGLLSAEHVIYVSPLGDLGTGDLRFGFSFPVVTNARDGDDDDSNDRTVQGSLRQFIQNANAVQGTQTSRFQIPNPPAPPHTVTLGSALPAVTQTIGLDASTQAGYASAPVVSVDGSSTAAGSNGFTLGSGTDGSVVRGFNLHSFPEAGIRIDSSHNHSVEGNYIGTTVAGTTADPNGHGVVINSGNNVTVGGTTTAARNVLSGNSGSGLVIEGGTGDVVKGNYIGVGATGGALGNGVQGVHIGDGATNTEVGGGTAGERNVISANLRGVVLSGSAASGVSGALIRGNYIGTDTAGAATAGYGNTRQGVALAGNVDDNVVGGTAAGEGNTISSSGGDGVEVFTHLSEIPDDNAIVGNSISSNDGLAIDLAEDADGDFVADTENGVTANDAGDADTGANALLNAPVLTSADLAGGNATINYSLDVPAGDYRVEFFRNSSPDASGYGEAEIFASAETVTGPLTNDTITFPAGSGDHIAATVTEDLGGGVLGSTSELSLAVQVGTSSVPVNTVIIGVGGTRSVGLGDAHSCAERSDGRLYCWGANASGQVGDGTSGTPRAEPVRVSGLSGVKLAGDSTSSGHTCALRSDGTSWCWGEGSLGRLGNGSDTPSNDPVQVSNLTDVKQVATGGSHSCAARADGRVWCWGGNDQGQLGDGGAANSNVPVQVVKGVGDPLTGVVEIAAGARHTCARLSAGNVWCWGDNANGQLGNGGALADSNVAVDTSVVGALDVGAGSTASCAARVGGSLVCWGTDILGLGSGDLTSPVQHGTVADAAEVAGGGEHLCIATHSGSVRCAGSNGSGQLGDGSTGAHQAFAAVTGLGHVISLDLGGFHSCAVRADGRALCWGMNTNGQVGDDGQGVDRLVPVPIAVF